MLPIASDVCRIQAPRYSFEDYLLLVRCTGAIVGRYRTQPQAQCARDLYNIMHAANLQVASEDDSAAVAAPIVRDDLKKMRAQEIANHVQQDWEHLRDYTQAVEGSIPDPYMLGRLEGAKLMHDWLCETYGVA